MLDKNKNEIWLSPMTKAPYQQKIQQPIDRTKTTKNFDYTMIADKLRTISWSNNSHPTGVVKPVYERSTLPVAATAVLSKGHTFKNL